MRPLIALLLAFLLAACALPGGDVPSYDEPPASTPDGLERFESPVFELVYVKPGLDLSGSDRIRIRPIGIGYKAEPNKGRLLRQVSGNFELTPEQRTIASRAFARAFSQAMTREDRFRLVTGVEVGAIQVQIALARLELNIPPATPGKDDVLMVDKVGEMTLVVDVSDASTGEPLIRGRDTYVFENPTGSELRSEALIELEELFVRWSGQIRAGFDNLSPGR